MDDEGVRARGLRRERRAMTAATLANGPTELIDFVLPLWAGAAIGLSATEVGVLMAVEMALSVVVRPMAGVLADRWERRHTAAVGALLYAISCAGYAVAQSAPLAYAAAAVGGAGGALLWVAVRAIVSERLAEDSAVFSRLFSAQETGTWVAFVVGIGAVGAVGYAGLFWGCAVACAGAAVALLTAPRRRDPADDRPGPGPGPDPGAGLGADPGVGAGLGAGADVVAGADVGADAGVDVGAGVDAAAAGLGEVASGCGRCCSRW